MADGKLVSNKGGDVLVFENHQYLLKDNYVSKVSGETTEYRRCRTCHGGYLTVKPGEDPLLTLAHERDCPGGEERLAVARGVQAFRRSSNTLSASASASFPAPPSSSIAGDRFNPQFLRERYNVARDAVPFAFRPQLTQFRSLARTSQRCRNLIVDNTASPATMNELRQMEIPAQLQGPDFFTSFLLLN